MQIREMLNGALDRLVRPTIRLRRRAWPAFQVCGCTGLELAVLLALGLTLYRGLSPWVMGAVIGAAIFSFYALTYAVKIVTGREQLVYYHHEIAVMLNAALLLWLLGQPVLAYLDATILGLGAFLACGRVGCLMAGCCHGRPHRWGVRYRAEHAAIGFPRAYVGVRLFPIQAVESLWVAAIVVIGAVMILRGAAPGAALAWYVVMYDIGRFSFEFVRGDADRPYYLGFSEGQWLALILTLLVVAGGLTGMLVFELWHALAAAGLALTMLAVALVRRRAPARRLLHPHHIHEIAAALAQAPADPAQVRVIQTSLGLQLSASRPPGQAGGACHYAISAQSGALSEESAQALADLLLQLRHDSGTIELVRSSRGVFHLLVQQ